MKENHNNLSEKMNEQNIIKRLIELYEHQEGIKITYKIVEKKKVKK